MCNTNCMISNLPYYQKSYFDTSSYCSVSTFEEHIIIVSSEGEAQGFGENRNCQISPSIPKQNLRNFTNIPIKDNKNITWSSISAVCGQGYSLYLLSNPNYKLNRLALSIYDCPKEGYPLFIDVKDRNPISLFGGRYHSAAIDSYGEIILIRPCVEGWEPSVDYEIGFLPDSRAVSIAFNEFFCIALGENGQVYKSYLTDELKFKKVSELVGKSIVHISGTSDHCFAVTQDGKVFGFGSNSCGQLGVADIKSYDMFTEIKTLSIYKIIAAYAGVNHSLFQTIDGNILACGNNSKNQLLQNIKSDECIFRPIQTSVKCNASFCIAGYNVSVVFLNYVPKNCPNNLVIIKKFQRKEKINEIKILSSEEIHSLHIIREISIGGNGKVLEVEGDEKYALKIMLIQDCSIEKQQKFLGEYEKLNMLSHPNIIKTYGIYLSDETTPFSILLEYCPSNIQDEIKKDSLSKVDIIKYIYQIVEAMKYVHFNKIIHRDLKPLNILIGKDNLIRVCDFGISKLMTVEEQTTTFGIGTLGFTAPEILNQNKFDEKVDVYSFGVLLYFMLSKGEMPKITIIQVGTGKKAEIPETFTEFSRELINRCWDFDPKQRPSFSDILQILHNNDFKLFNLNDHEINEIHNFVEMYSKTIPRCFEENKQEDTKIQPQEEKIENIKILVVGDMGAGETSFIRRYYRDFFSEFYKCTIGVDFAERKIDWNYNTKYNIQMWDIAGQELYGNLLHLYFQESLAAFIVFDVTRPGSLDIAVRWKEEIDKLVCTNKKKPIPVVLIANKIDLIENNLFFVTKEQIENFVSENNFVAYFRTSCRFRANVKEAVNFLIKYILTNDIKPLKTDTSQNNKKDDLQPNKKCFIC